MEPFRLNGGVGRLRRRSLRWIKVGLPGPHARHDVARASAGAGDVGGMDVASLVKDIVGGGVGGAVVMAAIGFLRNAMMKR